METNLGSTFSQTGEMPGPTEQKQRKTIQEEGELVAAFNLADKEGNLNFILLTCNFKKHIFHVKHCMKVKNNY